MFYHLAMAQNRAYRQPQIPPDDPVLFWQEIHLDIERLVDFAGLLSISAYSAHLNPENDGGVYVDGQRVVHPIPMGGGALLIRRRLPLPAGKHVVELRFAPTFETIVGATVLGLPLTHLDITIW